MSDIIDAAHELELSTMVLATRAGVHMATAMRALRGEHVSESTKAKLTGAIREIASERRASAERVLETLSAA